MALAGPNAAEREEVVKFLDSSSHTNFVILFKGVLGGTSYMALYEHDEEGEVRKLLGPSNAPAIIEASMV